MTSVKQWPPSTHIHTHQGARVHFYWRDSGFGGILERDSKFVINIGIGIWNLAKYFENRDRDPGSVKHWVTGIGIWSQIMAGFGISDSRHSPLPHTQTNTLTNTSNENKSNSIRLKFTNFPHRLCLRFFFCIRLSFIFLRCMCLAVDFTSVVFPSHVKNFPRCDL